MHPLANDQSVIRGGLPAFSVKVTIFESKIDLALLLFLLGPELTDTRAKEDRQKSKNSLSCSQASPFAPEEGASTSGDAAHMFDSRFSYVNKATGDLPSFFWHQSAGLKARACNYVCATHLAFALFQILPYSKFLTCAPTLCCDRVDWNMKQEECESCFAWLKVGCRVHLTRKP